MAETIYSDFSNHTMFVQEIQPNEMPDFDHKEGLTSFYVVRNRDASGCIFMYLGKGLKSAPREIVAWYPKGGFWSSYGLTFKTAIEGAQHDGWLSA